MVYIKLLINFLIEIEKQLKIAEKSLADFKEKQLEKYLSNSYGLSNKSNQIKLKFFYKLLQYITKFHLQFYSILP